MSAALRYGEMGLAVIPLRGKIPIYQNWPEVATTDPILIHKWWTQNPTSNVGIVTGKRSHVFVLDVDPRHGGQDTLESLWGKHGRFPATWQDTTGSGGKHYYFRYPAFRVENKAALLPGLDVRGEHGQVVAPPSVHPETHRLYEWDGLLEPWDDREGLSEAPVWLLDLLQPRTKSEPLSIPSKIPKGTQHTTLVSLAGQMRRLGLSPGEIFPTLMEVNRSRCEDPGPEQNIRQIAQSMGRYQPHERNLFSEASRLWRLTRWHEERAKESHEALDPIDGQALLGADLKPVKELIDGMLYNGVTILAGPPKSGKSYLTLCMAISVSTGGRFLSQKAVTGPGRVAYFALEESKRRTASRLLQLTVEGARGLENIEFLYSIKSLQQGGLADLETYIATARPNLVIIDTLMALVTGDRNARGDIFRQDYREIKSLQEIANRYDTAVLVVHHTNKAGGQGVRAVAGTHGVTAAADCIWIMERQPARRAVLEITGREVEDQAFLIELELREPVGWMLIEQGEDVVLSGERQVILEILRSGESKSPKQLASEIGKSPMATRQLLRRMLAAGLIIQESHGAYRSQNIEDNRSWHDRRDDD